MSFIKATEQYNSCEKNVPAPYIRKSFICEEEAEAEIKIAVCGFYELYINGKKITKGRFAPYINNTDDYIYYDRYKAGLHKGENVIGILLGNGFHNNPGGYVWDFDKTDYTSAPMVDLTLTYKNSKEETVTIKSDESFKTHPSPIIFDDYRFGEYYDANLEIPGWNQKGFDDTHWTGVINSNPPKGEIKECLAEPIVECEKIKPVEIFKSQRGYIYDFGQVNAGVCTLCVKGVQGQKIEMQHFDVLENGEPNTKTIWFPEEERKKYEQYRQKDVYILSGEGTEIYTPTFTYHGFRYVEVRGLEQNQATEELLTYTVLHSRTEDIGGFSCSDEMVNKIQEITLRSLLSNYHYFPTDCPQREKNGWTADAVFSSESLLLNYNPETSYNEWLLNICKAQNDEGALPGIVPTGGWGFQWGNGPGWDCALTIIPYNVYKYTGNKDILENTAPHIFRYLKYIDGKKDEKGLIHIGLEDWCQVGRVYPPTSPLEVTDTAITVNIAEKAGFIFETLGMEKECKYAKKLRESLKKAMRDNLIDFTTMTVAGNCQTSQALCIEYGIFEDNEMEKAFERLIGIIHKDGDVLNTGMIGGKVIFHVLSRFGYTDLAYKMITGPEYPSYGDWIKRGATTLWEDFFPETDDDCKSHNHHAWGDVSAWFIKRIAGICLNPNAEDVSRVDIKPHFVGALEYAKGYHIAPKGKIEANWERKGEKILLTLEIPCDMKANLYLDEGYTLKGASIAENIKSGMYEIVISAREEHI